MMSTLEYQLRTALQEEGLYDVSTEHELLIHPDPKVDDVYAVRCTLLNDDGSIMTELGDFIISLNDDRTVDEVEFDTWPPTSGPLSFFL